MIGYNLRLGDQVTRAVLTHWINGHTAVFQLCGPLGCFKGDDVIRLNLNTLEASLYVYYVEEAA